MSSLIGKSLQAGKYTLEIDFGIAREFTPDVTDPHQSDFSRLRPG